MIDFEKLKVGDNFFEYCNPSWITQIGFIRLNDRGIVTYKYINDSTTEMIRNKKIINDTII